MRRIRYWVIQLMGVSKSEANGVILLFILLTFILALPYLLKFSLQNNYNAQLTDSKLLDSILQTITIKDAIHPSESKNITLRKFKPNNVSNSELLTLGFSSKQSSNIVNYVKKGGAFRIKKDLLKIYSIDSSFYNKVESYLLLPDEYPSYKQRKKPFISQKNKGYIRKEISNFDINKADTITLKQINGIGSVLSNRIVKYRESLGGFVNLNQLNEVYGLNDSTLIKLTEKTFISDSSIQKINVNKTDYHLLQKHPYINRKVANAIIVYRNQHSNYQSVNDLLKIHLITPEIFEKMQPYITVE